MSHFQHTKTEYRGLSNQGATCYMNSLLQTLFMTPEFRQKIYRWNFDQSQHGEPKDSIPYQLQALFGQLQTSREAAVNTKGLTKSFQWDIRDSFQQHDVQEFCRILFDAIELSFKNTEQANIIKELYEGTMEDYIYCQGWNRKKSKEDKFLDLSLTVRNQFDKVYNSSVEAAIDNYLKVDKLEGDNKYECENCNKKTNALKGLKFRTMPPILLLHLKRFDLDISTMQRVKLNDYVKFPRLLNMNPYVQEGYINSRVFKDFDISLIQRPKTQPSEPDQQQDNAHFSTRPRYFESLQLQSVRTTHSEDLRPDSEPKVVNPEPFMLQNLREKKARLAREKHERKIKLLQMDGEFVYELFAVMIHSGSAQGGHYFAYIRSFDTGQWYNFNDSSVTAIDENALKDVFGGGPDVYKQSTNAYLLSYRKVGPHNLATVPNSEVPNHILEEMNRAKVEEEARLREMNERAKYIKLSLVYKREKQMLNIKRDQMLSDLKELIIEKYNLNSIAPDNLRLRKYDWQFDIFEEPIEAKRGDAVIEQLGFNKHTIYTFEIKATQEKFETYDAKHINVSVNNWVDSYAYDCTSLQQKTTDPIRIALPKSSALKNLVKKIQAKTGIDPANQLLIRKCNQFEIEKLDLASDKNKKLNDLGIVNGCKLYLEFLVAESKWEQEFQQEAYRITVFYNKPGIDSKEGQRYNESLVFDTRLTLRDLQDALASQLQIPSDTFYLKRSKESSDEFADLSVKFKEFSLTQKQVYLWIELGEPCPPGHFRLEVSHAKFATNNNLECYDLSHKFSITVSQAAKIDELAEKIRSHENLAPNAPLRMRRMLARNPEKLLVFGTNVGDFRLGDYKTITYQVLEQQERADIQHLIALVKLWNPSTEEISPVEEFLIDRDITYNQLNVLIADRFLMPTNKVEMCKVSTKYALYKEQLLSKTFTKNVGVSEKIDSVMISTHLLVVKNCDIKIKSNMEKRETGLSITVKENKQEVN